MSAVWSEIPHSSIKSCDNSVFPMETEWHTHTHSAYESHMWLRCHRKHVFQCVWWSALVHSSDQSPAQQFFLKIFSIQGLQAGMFLLSNQCLKSLCFVIICLVSDKQSASAPFPNMLIQFSQASRAEPSGLWAPLTRHFSVNLHFICWCQLFNRAANQNAWGQWCQRMHSVYKCEWVTGTGKILRHFMTCWLLSFQQNHHKLIEQHVFLPVTKIYKLSIKLNKKTNTLCLKKLTTWYETQKSTAGFCFTM